MKSQAEQLRFLEEQIQARQDRLELIQELDDEIKRLSEKLESLLTDRKQSDPEAIIEEIDYLESLRDSISPRPIDAEGIRNVFN